MVMGLSIRERIILRGIESVLRRSDPELDAALRRGPWPSARSARGARCRTAGPAASRLRVRALPAIVGALSVRVVGLAAMGALVGGVRPIGPLLAVAMACAVGTCLGEAGVLVHRIHRRARSGRGMRDLPGQAPHGGPGRHPGASGPAA
jgi:hypothetical protein